MQARTEKTSRTLQSLLPNASYEALEQLVQKKYGPRHEPSLLSFNSLEALLSLPAEDKGQNQALGPKTASSLTEWYIDHMLKAEGYFSFMYLDHLGNITIGRGTLLLPLDKAKFPRHLEKYLARDGLEKALADIQHQLSQVHKTFPFKPEAKFIIYDNPSAPNQGEVKGSTFKVALPMEVSKAVAYLIHLSDKRQKDKDLNYKASSYFNPKSNNLCLSKENIDLLALSALQQKINELKSPSVFPNYLSYPVGVQLALLDMAYNMNPLTFRKGFPRLAKLIDEGAWKKIALEVDAGSQGKPYFSRRDIPDPRNDATKMLFILATGISPSPVKK